MYMYTAMHGTHLSLYLYCSIPESQFYAVSYYVRQLSPTTSSVVEYNQDTKLYGCGVQ